MASYRDQLLDVFKKMDTNKDGRLDCIEIINYMTENGYHPMFARAYVDALDKDGDNCVSFEEFASKLETKPIPEETVKLANMRVVFNFFDQDKKGYIEEKDIKNFLSSSNASEEKKSKLAGTILQEFDVNKDKQISFEEFTSKMPMMADD